MEVEGSSWVSRAVASQLSWEVEQSTEKVEVRIGIGEDEWRCELRVHDDDERGAKRTSMATEHQ